MTRNICVGSFLCLSICLFGVDNVFLYSFGNRFQAENFLLTPTNGILNWLTAGGATVLGEKMSEHVVHDSYMLLLLQCMRIVGTLIGFDIH